MTRVRAKYSQQRQVSPLRRGLLRNPDQTFDDRYAYTFHRCVTSVNLHMLPSAMHGKRSPQWRQRTSLSIRLLFVCRRVSRGLRLYADELKA